jgi:hypothetical protein
MDGTDGTVELWGANDFLTKDEALALAELLSGAPAGCGMSGLLAQYVRQ